MPDSGWSTSEFRLSWPSLFEITFVSCLEQAGKKDEARTQRAKVEKINADWKRMTEVTRQIFVTPHDPAPRCEAGLIMLRNAEDEAGLRWLKSALQEDSNHEPTHQALADYFDRKGEFTLAARHRRLALLGKRDSGKKK